ncbi:MULTISPECIES: CHASE domain-containing protein [Pirellulaceae]|nr:MULTISPECIES: CHASE domain-containing protein [Pirellulaceae]
MKFNTALGLAILAGVGLLRSQTGAQEDRRGWTSLILAGGVFALAIVSLLEIASGLSLGIDTLTDNDLRSLSHGRTPGLMSTGTAVGLFLLSSSQLISGLTPSWVKKTLASLAGLLGASSVCLFLLRTNVRATSIFSTTAIHTAVLLTFIAAGYLLVWQAMSIISTSSDRDMVRSELFRVRALTAVVIGALSLGLFVTSNLVVDAQGTIREANQARFAYFTDLVVEDIERSINRVVFGLRGLRGLYMASKQVTRDEFAAMAQSHDLADEFPGAIGLGLIDHVKRENLDTYIREVRADNAPEFEVKTEGDAADLYVIKFIFPLARNRDAWGYDVGSEAVRRIAAETAVATGEPTITGPIELLQDKENRTGFLYLLPFYDTPETPETPQEREEKLQGLVYAPIILDEALAGIGDRTQGNVEVAIDDVEDNADGFATYGHSTIDETALGTAGHRIPVFAQQKTIVAGGRHWLVGITSSVQFESRIDRVTPAMIGVGGTILTILLVGVIWSMGRNMALAHNMMVEVQASEERAKEAQLMAEKASQAKSEFLANMSHEIRTPMNAIIGLTDSVLRTELTEDQRDYLSTVSDSSNTLLQIINDILDISKIEAGKIELDEEEFQPREFIANLLRAVTAKLQDRPVELVCQIEPNVPRVLIGDSRRLGQVLLNLLGNAMKFTEQGEIELRVARVSQEGRAAEEVLLEFAVRDTGIGIPESKLGTIFDVFEQADTSTTRRYGGTGLGLTISSRLVDRLGGEISVESKLNEGSVFRFTARFKPSISPIPTAWKETISGLQGRRALIVDDSETDLLMLREVTQSYQIETTSADSGHAALTELANAIQAGQPFDMVLVDLKMPHLDGYEVIEIIQNAPEKYGKPMVILISASKIGSKDPTHGLKIASRIRKPVKPSELLEAMVAGLGLEIPDDLSTGDNPEADTNTQPLEILLAEDSRANQKVATAILKRRNHNVSIAENGIEAIRAIQENTYDVVLMDVQMPEMDGLTAAYHIRQYEQQVGGHIPIVATTAHALKMDRERCLSAGMDEYISKPLSPDSLFAAIDNAIRKSRGERIIACVRGPLVASDEDEANAEPPVPWETLLKRLENDREALVEIVNAYIPEMTKGMDRIDEAIQQADDHLLTISAHKLKSALRFFHQMEASTIAQDLELRGTRNDFESAEQEASRLREMLTGLLPWLSTYCREQ